MRAVAVPSVSPRRMPAVILVAAIVAAAACSARAATVRPIGEFSNVGTTVSETTRGFEVALWRDGAAVIGLVTYVDGTERFSHTSLIRDAQLAGETGPISFRAKLSLAAHRDAHGRWTRAIRMVEFTGVLTETALVGRFAVEQEEEEEDERAPRFEAAAVTLDRLVVDGAATYAGHAQWLAANEPRVGTHEIAALAAAESATLAGRALQVGLAGGIFRADGDDARFFNTGGGHFVVDVLYTVSSRFSFGARVGLSHFDPNILAIGNELTPPGVMDASLQAPQSGMLFELAPVARVSTGDVFTDRTLVFVQASAGFYHVDLETPYSLAWTEGGHLAVKNGSIGHTGNTVGASASVGISIRVSEFSRFEIAPEYHRTFGAGDLSLFGVMAHFRVEFLHDSPPRP